MNGEPRPIISEDKARGGTAQEGPTERQVYTIRVQGHLDASWSEWLDNLTIHLETEGTTTLSGWVSDPSALYGLLNKLRDMGLPLISVNRRG